MSHRGVCCVHCKVILHISCLDLRQETPLRQKRTTVQLPIEQARPPTRQGLLLANARIARGEDGRWKRGTRKSPADHQWAITQRGPGVAFACISRRFYGGCSVPLYLCTHTWEASDGTRCNWMACGEHSGRPRVESGLLSTGRPEATTLRDVGS